MVRQQLQLSARAAFLQCVLREAASSTAMSHGAYFAASRSSLRAVDTSTKCFARNRPKGSPTHWLL